MKQSIDKLYKFFRLEAQRGYDNGAVVGGLEKMLDTWESEARVDGLDEPLIRAVTSRLRDYGGLNTKSRKVVLVGLWKRIQREAGGEIPSLDGSETRKRDVAPKRKSAPPPKESAPEVEASPSPQSDLPEGEDAPLEHESLAPTDSISPQENGASLDIEQPQEDDAPPVKKPSRKKKPHNPITLAVAKGEEDPAPLEAPVTVLSGVGPKHAESLERIGIRTLGNALYYFPRRYDDYSLLKTISQLMYNDEVTVIGTVQSVKTRPIKSGKMKIVEAVVSDGSAALRVSWFNQPWLAKQLKDAQIVMSGKIDQYLGRLTLTNPEWEPLETENLHTNRIVPVYPLTAKITQKWLREKLYQIVDYWAPRVLDPLPAKAVKKLKLMPLSEALQQVHFPESEEDLAAARFRIAFDEILLMQLGVMRQREHWNKRDGRVFDIPLEWLQAQKETLPFTLTSAQKTAVDDIRTDIASGHPMNRLLQGDVGSGKTVVAGMAIAMVTQAGSQAAVLAPTSILAEQHLKSLTRQLVENSAVLQPEQIRLMLGATSENEKTEIREKLADGTIKLVIGTHAILEDPVLFKELELIVIDEQHRFGVKQRAALRKKGSAPHLLVMTATPIPRSLALTIYGDLDITLIDEMPPGRQEIGTFILYPRERMRAYNFIEKQIREGFQAFIIYPLVEETEKSDSKAAVDEHKRLQARVFPKLNLGLLHGRLKADEKDQVMTKFRDQDYQVLVSTSVVEVGVDVPNATVMVIEGANRFGLSQLHQFRGRVGRGSGKSYCLLIPETDDQAENERLQAMVATNDGFVLAERDLEQRGPGEFLGTRQSGYSDLKMANITDVPLIEKARRYAKELFESDPELLKQENQLLSKALDNFWDDGKGDVS